WIEVEGQADTPRLAPDFSGSQQTSACRGVRPCVSYPCDSQSSGCLLSLSRYCSAFGFFLIGPCDPLLGPFIPREMTDAFTPCLNFCRAASCRALQLLRSPHVPLCLRLRCAQGCCCSHAPIDDLISPASLSSCAASRLWPSREFSFSKKNGPDLSEPDCGHPTAIRGLLLFQFE